jgi:hypothetical protein
VRGTGQSFAYNFGRATSGFFIQGVALLAAFMPVSAGMLIAALFGIASAMIATFMLPETAGRDLARPLTGDER